MATFIEKAYNQNPWWTDERSIEDDYQVKELQKSKLVFLNQDFLRHHFADGVYIVTGPRQIGKTTHLKLLIQDKITASTKENFFYFNCDLLDSKQDIVTVIEEYFRLFPNKGRKFILLDEISSVRDGILAIKYLVDKGEIKNVTYILTGSSTVNIRKTGEFLPGRRGKGKDFVFLPLQFKDFILLKYPEASFSNLSAAPLEKNYQQIQSRVPLHKEFNAYLASGGIPRIINDYAENKEIGQDNFRLYRDWLVSEVAKNGKRDQIVKIILQRVLISLGSDISYNSFAADMGIGSHNTVYDYLTFLEDAFVLEQLYHYDYRQKKLNLRKNKKIYLKDSFLFWLLDWWLNGNPNSYKELPKNSMIKSQIVENLVFLHLKSLFPDLFFYKETREIDFLYQDMAWECKYQNRISPEDFKALVKFPGKRFVVTKTELTIRKEYECIPIELFLLLGKEYFLERK